MTRYRRKPTKPREVDAVEWQATDGSYKEVEDLAGAGRVRRDGDWLFVNTDMSRSLVGGDTLKKGDFVIKGADGIVSTAIRGRFLELYEPCE